MRTIYIGLASLLLFGQLNGQTFLDPTWGDAGLARYDPDNVECAFADMVVQPDGKVVAAGYVGSYPDQDAIAVRFNTDGTLDDTWGIGGLSMVSTQELHLRAVAISLDAAGRVLLCGQLSDSSPPCVARLNLNGSLDAGFGSSGITQLTQLLGWELADIAVSPQGSIVIACRYGNAIAAFSLDVNGQPQLGFGITGAAILSSLPDIFEVRGLGIDQLGRILISASLQAEGIVVARVNTNGALDPGFGSSGAFVHDNPSTAGGLACLATGAIVVTGMDNTNWPRDLLIFKLTQNGVLDATFGDGGVVDQSISPDASVTEAQPLPLLNGDLLVGGRAYQTLGWGVDRFFFTKHSATGSLDTGFGLDGIIHDTISAIDDNGLFGAGISQYGRMYACGVDNWAGGAVVAGYLSTAVGYAEDVPCWNTITVYPDPATSYFSVHCPDYLGKVASIQIFDASGRVRSLPSISAIGFTDATFNLEGSGLARGVYTVLLYTDTARSAARLIVE